MNETIFDQINNIKQVANDYVGRLIDFYGSPENDMPVLEVKPFGLMTFDGVVDIKKVKKTDYSSRAISLKYDLRSKKIYSTSSSANSSLNISPIPCWHEISYAILSIPSIGNSI